MIPEFIARLFTRSVDDIQEEINLYVNSKVNAYDTCFVLCKYYRWLSIIICAS